MKVISNKRTSDYIAELIQNEILSGRMKSNQQLIQEELAEKLGASRIPIREALHTLENIGMVKRLSTRHIIVSNFSDESIHEIYGMICDIQLKSIFNICKRAEIEDMRKELKIVKDQYLVDEIAFHKLFIKYMDNQFMIRLMENQINSYIRYAVIELKYDRKKQQRLIKNIIRGLEENDIKYITENINYYYCELIKNVVEERMKNK